MSWLKKPSTPGGVVYFLVLAMMLAGIVLVGLGTWRTGVVVMGSSFALAFIARAVLPDDLAGMLRIRRRFVDLITMAVCCGGLVALAFVIPTRS
ncbi:MAG: DUF3017 domain-containing protein [Nocardioidaceae bacterium]|nr:DUF3017 domain-containing protein [Nocardioidaceae bacterium]